MLTDRRKVDDRRDPLVTGMFRDRDRAERAYDALRRRGYSDNEIHMLMSDEAKRRHFGDDDGRHTGLGNKALEGAGLGAGIGGAVGATLTALAAAGTALAIPGIGLVIAGPLAGALAGAGAGGAAGGLLGTLIGAGIPEERAKLYEDDLRRGDIMLGVRPRTEDDAAELEREWTTHGEHVYR